MFLFNHIIVTPDESLLDAAVHRTAVLPFLALPRKMSFCVSLGSKVCFQFSSWVFCTLGKSPLGLFHESAVSKANVFCNRSHPASPVTLNRGSGVPPFLCLCAGVWARIILALYGIVKPLPRFLTDGLRAILCQVHSCMD